MDDSPWDDDAIDHDISRSNTEWNNLSESFTNAGYREGITAGKESALQEGFDSAFESIGVPLGRELGSLRGMAAALVALLSSSPLQSNELENAREIASQLSEFRFSDIVPRDEEAERHALEHLKDEEEPVVDDNEELKAKRDMERLEDLMAGTSATTSSNGKPRPKAEDLQQIKQRLFQLFHHLGFAVPSSA